MPPSHLRHDSDKATDRYCLRYGSDVRTEVTGNTQRPCQSLPPACLRSWLEFDFAGMPALKTSDVSWAVGVMSSYVGVVSAAATSQVARRHMRTRLNPNNPKNQCLAKLISILPMSFWKGELSTILMTLFLDEMQDSDSARKQERIKTRREEEKKENDMIIFQEMITIPNQEEIDELVGGRSTCRFVIPRCK